MIGREIYQYPETLFEQFSEMVASRSKKQRAVPNWTIPFMKAYVFLFGIPEIGLQLRWLYFQKFLKNIKNPRTILDAGSGIGQYAFKLSKKFPQATIYGVDIDDTKLKLAKKIAKEKQIRNLVFQKSNIETPDLKIKFDFIISIDVLEHIKNYQKVLKNFSKSLRKNGYLYIHAPLINQKRIFKQLEKWGHKDHVREGFVLSALIKEIENNGFVIVKVEKTFGFLGKLAWELQMLFLRKSLVLAGIVYPLLYGIGFFDIFFQNKEGLCIAILARKC